MMRRSRGFTLIELLVVLVIVATLLTIAVPRYFRSLDQARETTLLQDLSVMRDAIDKFMGDTGHYPATLGALVDNRYLKAIPVDPITKSNESWVLVASTDTDHTGIRDVLSGAEGVSLKGVAFRDF
jgi:general secretion pathway protein G